MESFYFTCLIIICCGIFGGLANYFSSDENEKFSMFKLNRSLMIGIVSAFTVPLFLEMVSSNLLAEAETNNIKYLVFIGFCLIAAFYANRFLDSVANNIFRDHAEVKKKTVKMEENSSKQYQIVQDIAYKRSDSFESNYKNIKPDKILIEPQIIAEQKIRKSISPLIDLKDEIFRDCYITSDKLYRTIEGVAKEKHRDRSEISEIFDELEKEAKIEKAHIFPDKNLYRLKKK